MKAQQNIKISLIPKLIRVIESCKTAEQLKVAERYLELTLKASLSPAYSQVITIVKDFFDLQDELKSLIKSQKIHM